MKLGSEGDSDSLASVLGCRMVMLPIRYLGLPLDTNYKDLKTWDTVVNRFEKRLVGWKRDLLSKGGRLTYIKSTLINLLIYYMSIFYYSDGYIQEAGSYPMQFPLGDTEDRRKYHLVARNKLKKPIPLSGLSLWSLLETNEAMQGKWLWRFMKEEGVH